MTYFYRSYFFLRIFYVFNQRVKVSTSHCFEHQRGCLETSEENYIEWLVSDDYTEIRLNIFDAYVSYHKLPFK